MKTLFIIIAVVIIYLLFRRSKSKDEFRLHEWEKDLSTIWRGAPKTIEFSYESFKEEKTRRKVDVRKIVKNSRGIIYLRGFCHLRNEERTFRADNITSKILESGHHYNVGEWLLCLHQDHNNSNHQQGTAS